MVVRHLRSCIWRRSTIFRTPSERDSNHHTIWAACYLIWDCFIIRADARIMKISYRSLSFRLLLNEKLATYLIFWPNFSRFILVEHLGCWESCFWDAFYFCRTILSSICFDLRFFCISKLDISYIWSNHSHYKFSYLTSVKVSQNQSIKVQSTSSQLKYHIANSIRSQV